MLTPERLRFSYINKFKELNSRKNEFNSLNDDFFKFYSRSGFLSKFFLRKQVYLFKYNNDFVGFIWCSKAGSDKSVYLVNSLYIDKKYVSADSSRIMSVFELGTTLYYEGKLHSLNENFINNMGFSEKYGTYELKLHMNSRLSNSHSSDITFVSFKRGKHERVRCELQNSIFSSVERAPLTVQDILLDEIQDYYVNDWCIFIKYNSAYVGYGQVIMNNCLPLIVNFGIVKEYRERGFGDLLLTYLLNLLFDTGYKEIKIKVNTNNIPAFELYKKKGFEIIDQYKTWTTIIET